MNKLLFSYIKYQKKKIKHQERMIKKEKKIIILMTVKINDFLNFIIFIIIPFYLTFFFDEN